MTNNKKRKYHRAVKVQKKRTKRTVKSKAKAKGQAFKDSRRMTKSNFLKKYKQALEEHKKHHGEGNCTADHGHEEKDGVVDSKVS